MTSLSVVIAPGDVEALAESLGRLDKAAFGALALKAVNDVTERTYTLARSRMLAEINLPDAYVRERMQVDLATNPNAPRATIYGLRAGANRGATLTTYGATVVTRPVNWPNGSFTPGKLAPNPRKPGHFLPWKPRIGNAALGIPAGQKAAGFQVNVTRGNTSLFPHAFLIPAKNGVLLTVRRVPGTTASGKGKVDAVRGPSVWQLFRATIPKIYNTVESDLAATLSAEVDKALQQL